MMMGVEHFRQKLRGPLRLTAIFFYELKTKAFHHMEGLIVTIVFQFLKFNSLPTPTATPTLPPLYTPTPTAAMNGSTN